MSSVRPLFERRACGSLVELLHERAVREPARRCYTFLTDGAAQEAHDTYGSLDARARAIAGRLAAVAPPGARALLLFPPGLEYLRALFACFYAGIIAVPVYPPRRDRVDARLEAILRDCTPHVALGPSALLADRDRLTHLLPALADMEWLTLTDTVYEEARWDGSFPAPSGIAFLQYTSGSTSAPKGVMVTHANLVHNCAVIEELVGYTRDDRSVTWLPPYHDMGLIGNLLQPMYTGYWTALMAPTAFAQRPLRWLEAISRYAATTSGGPNFAYQLCVEGLRRSPEISLDLSRWRIAFNGSEPVRQGTLAGFSTAFAPFGFRGEAFYPCYGLAEATLMVSGGRAHEPPTVLAVDPDALASHTIVPADAGAPSVPLVACGRAAAGHDVRVVDPETCRPCASGTVGEIWARGPSVALGYWNAPEATAATFRATLADTGDGPYLRTGDLGAVYDGELYVTGRRKELLIIRGRNLYPQDLELTAARAHPILRIGGGAAFSVDEGGQERPALVQEVSRHATPDDLDAAVAAIRSAILAEHGVHVAHVVLVRQGRVPRTTSGKIKRLICRDDFLAGRLESLLHRAFTAPLASGLGVELLTWGRAQWRSVSAGDRRDLLATWVRAWLERAIPGYAPGEGGSLVTFGLDSLGAATLAADLRATFDVWVTPERLLGDVDAESLAALVDESLDDEPTAPPDQPEVAPKCCDGPMPLTAAQERFWFLQQLDPDSAAYNLALGVEIHGPLQREVLAQALRALVARHEALRTHYPRVAGYPMAATQPEATCALVVDDLTALPEPERGAAADAVRRRVAGAPFRLDESPPFRAHLLYIGPDRHELVVVVHHIAADAPSLATMVRMIAAEYDACRNGRAASVAPEAPGRLGAYAARERAWLASPQAEDALSWWCRRLAAMPRLPVPVAAVPPVGAASRSGSVHHFAIARETAEKIAALARDAGTTPFAVLTAAWQLLLARWCGVSDVGIGVPVSLRGADEEEVIGALVNTVVVRTTVRVNEPFLALLKRVAREVIDASAHRQLPFERLVRALKVSGAPGRNPLFSVMLAMQERPPRRAVAGDVMFTPVRRHAGAAPLELLLHLAADERGGLDATLEYATDLFPSSEIAQVAERFVALLAAVSIRPHLACGSLVAPSEGAGPVLVHAGVDRSPMSAPTPGAPVDVLFERQAARTPDRAAVRHAGAVTTYASLAASAGVLARHLETRGVGTEARVGVLLSRTPRLVEAMLAVWQAGGTYVPLDSTHPDQRLALLIRDAQLALVVTEAALAARVPAAVPRVLVDDLPVGGDDARSRSNRGRSHRAAAYVLYTSGSTGQPKGVVVEHGSFAALLHALDEVVPPELRCGVLASTPVSFDVSLGEIFGTLCWGGTLVLAEHALDPSWLATEDVRVVVTVPTTAWALVRRGGIPRSVRQFNLAGEALPAALVDALYALGHVERVINLYGPTEHTVYSTWCSTSPKQRTVPIGRPIRGGLAYVLDAAGLPASSHTGGELFLGGLGVARGYFGRPALTAERFLPDPSSTSMGARIYRTGDAVRQLPDGQLEYMGRVDDQVKVRGVRIEPTEVEALLCHHPDVQDAAVGARAAPDGSPRLVAWVVPRDGAPPPSGEVCRQFLADRLPLSMVPDLFVPVTTLPCTPSGKLDRRALRLPLSPTPGSDRAEPPSQRTLVEELLAPIWADVLQVPNAGPGDDFFALGGHSLLAIRLVERVREATGTLLPLRALFDAPTPRALAERIVLGLGAPAIPANTAPVSELPPAAGNSVPLSFAQERLWFAEQLRPGGAAYVMPAPLRIGGLLNEAALRGAVDGLRTRHAALRVRIAVEDGRPSQVVEPPRPLIWTVLDMRRDGAPAAVEDIDRLCAEEAERPFDLERGPLMRATLARVADDEWLLFLVFHHLVCDGWSLNVLASELSTLYSAACGQPGPPLRPVRVQYPEFAVWQRAQLTPARCRELQQWWRDRLTPIVGAPEIPTDRPRGATPLARGAVMDRALGPEVTARIRRLARERSVTPFTVLLAGWLVVQHRRAGGSRVVVGTDVAGRDRVMFAEAVGLFVNQVVLVAEVGDDPSFTTLLARLRETLLETLAHAELPFHMIVDAVNPPRDPSRNPLFQVMVVQDNTPETLVLSGAEVAASAPWMRGAPFDLSLLLGERSDHVRCQLRYNTELFEAATIEEVLDDLVTALDVATVEPTLGLATIQHRMNDAERERRATEARRRRDLGVQVLRRRTDSDAPALAPPSAALTRTTPPTDSGGETRAASLDTA